MWYFNKDNGNFAVGSIPTVEVDGEIVEEQGWEQIPTRPEPHDNYVFDGIGWVGRVVELIVPQTITKLQAMKQMKVVGKWEAFKTVLANDEDINDEWVLSDNLNRTYPLVLGVGQLFGFTDDDMDTFFIEASRL